ncbi:SMI1/KNR4 family protein [Acidovorax sp. LjRoot129]|uniref:SMI1/KNR4 family protein n=1 Tax=Acidovorax sp. LjRoot129 TaxID=3342260 RepID=UPI003ECD1CAC
MTRYTSHWLQTPADQKSPSARPLVIQIAVTPYGYDGKAYWRRQEAQVGDAQFKVIEELELPGEPGARAMVDRFLRFREEQRQHPGSEEIWVPGRSMVLFPGDLEPYQRKTDDECLMDRAALCTECGDEAGALAALQASLGSADGWYWRTVARRAHANRARAATGDGARQDWDKAVEHAAFLLHLAHDQDLYRVETYWFGDSFNSACTMTALAATTAAEFFLKVAEQPEMALQAAQIGDATHHASRDLQELKAEALLRLGRLPEAYETHRKHGLGMPQIEDSEGYRSYVSALEGADQQAERQRVGQLRFEWIDGAPASQGDLDTLQEKFGALPPAYVQWITSTTHHTLKVVDGDDEEVYALLSASEALQKHEEFVGWIHLHDDNAPEFAQEIHQLIRDAGIDPLRMLPIVGGSWTPDCFMLRTDGPHAGTVYFWGHEEIPTFIPIVASVDQLFAGLVAQAQAGQTFVL